MAGLRNVAFLVALALPACDSLIRPRPRRATARLVADLSTPCLPPAPTAATTLPRQLIGSNLADSEYFAYGTFGVDRDYEFLRPTCTRYLRAMQEPTLLRAPPATGDAFRLLWIPSFSGGSTALGCDLAACHTATAAR